MNLPSKQPILENTASYIHEWPNASDLKIEPRNHHHFVHTNLHHYIPSTQKDMFDSDILDQIVLLDVQDEERHQERHFAVCISNTLSKLQETQNNEYQYKQKHTHVRGLHALNLSVSCCKTLGMASI